jgi:hypothetical protein
MKLTRIAVVLLAVLVVATGAAAALPGNAPTDAPVEQPANDSDDATREANDPPAVAAGGESDRVGGTGEAPVDRQGPPADLPSQVPDFVSGIHDLINQKIDGTISNLGEEISSVTPSDAADDEDGDDES